jgi:antitoxin MazE
LLIRSKGSATLAFAIFGGKAMRASIRKLGNSSGVIIPKPILSQIGVEAGDDLDLSLDKNRIVLARVKRNPCAEWAEAAKRLAEAEDDFPVWSEFGNAGDTELKW